MGLIMFLKMIFVFRDLGLGHCTQPDQILGTSSLETVTDNIFCVIEVYETSSQQDIYLIENQDSFFFLGVFIGFDIFHHITYCYMFLFLVSMVYNYLRLFKLLLSISANQNWLNTELSRPRWSRGNVLASRSKVRGFKSG